MATAEYTKKAINKYNAKFDRVAVNLPKGTKERIKAAGGKSANDFINKVVLEYLEEVEKKNK